MVALEALREELVHIDHDIDDLDDCISHNDEDISENDHGIAHNHEEIEDNEHEISDQEHRVERACRACRRLQHELDEERDFLILHCQQFAFAPDMVGACADILTCANTRLAYRADVFDGGQHHALPQDGGDASPARPAPQPATTQDLRVPATRAELEKNGLTLRRGESATLLIDENPSTGFVWSVDQSATGGLFRVGESFIAPDTELLGAGGELEFELTAGNRTGRSDFRIARSQVGLSFDEVESLGEQFNYV